jgi:ribonuclease E
MSDKILINALDPAECRIARVKASKLEAFHIESAAREITQGNIYKGIIIRIEPSLQAVFVDYGAERHGFLQKHEIHPDYYHDTPSGDRSIKGIVKRGQELLVQVTKDPHMSKGAMLTTYISLAGRYLVLMPGSESKGVSRKIEDEKERARLKEIIDGLSIPEGYGVIVRTAGENAAKTPIGKDFRYLMRLWKTIKGNVMQVTAPALLHKERDLVVRSLRDYFTPDITEILIDENAIYEEVKEFIGVISPKDKKIVKFYKGPKPIFSKHQLEEQIASIYESRVALKSGGSIVIEQTEALVSIDVNSGKGTQKQSIEQTALMTDLEAAEEIARQLRLRDMGGLIVIDFIDMRETKHKLEVERALKTHLKADKAKVKVGKISQFGLLEMSRQRIRPSIESVNFQPCRYCQGKGLTPTTESLGSALLRRLSLETLKSGATLIRAVVPAAVADYVLNRKRRELNDLETLREIRIQVEADMEMVPGQANILYES